MWWELILNSLLLGVGLAMDACAVSMANGMNEPQMKKGKACVIALLFGFFQALMPLVGWACVHTVAQQFSVFTKAVPYIALVLLGFIGGKMIYEGARKQSDETPKELTAKVLVTQAVATSIDALSAGFTVADYNAWQALVCVGIVAVVTFAICFAAVFIGKKFGAALGRKAVIFGGVILIGIGVEIFVRGVFFA